VGPDSLTPFDVQRLAAVLGPAGPNLTRAQFVNVPDWIYHPPVPPSPCLFSPKTGFNVYLFEDGWRDAALAEAGGTACPHPEGGQLPMSNSSTSSVVGGGGGAAVPQVSVVLAFRNAATDTIRALLSIIQNAAQVESIEVLLLDIASE
jgi:hypothetical protein